MGFLESLGAGLRYGGSALAGAGSPDVFREQAQERGRVKEAGRDRQAKMAEIMLRTAHSGQIPQERLPAIQQAMAKLGYDLPLELLSPTPDAMEKLSEYARTKEDRAKLQAANLSMENFYDQPPPGLGAPGQGLNAGAPPPLQQVPMPPRPGAGLGPQGMPLNDTPPPNGVQTFPLGSAEDQPVASVAPSTVMPEKSFTTGAVLDQDLVAAGIPKDRLNEVHSSPLSIKQMYDLVNNEEQGRQHNPDYAITSEPAIPNAGRSIPPIVQSPQEPMVPGPVPGGGNVPGSRMNRWKELVRAKNAGAPVAAELFKQLLGEMYPAKKDLLLVPEGGTAINASGDVVYRGQPKTSALSDVGKLIQERTAMIATDPSNPMIAKYDEAIGEASARKSAASSDLGKLVREREALALSDPNHPMLAKYDETIKNYKQAANVKDDSFKNANVLRDEFNTHSKTFASMANARRQIIEAARDPTAAGDLSLLYGYMKSLDPTSVVRESEFAMAAEAGSLPDRIQGWATKIINGERLTDKIRNDFVNQSAKLYDAAVVDQEKLTNRYRGIAQRNNIPEIDVVGDFGTESKAGSSKQPVSSGSARTDTGRGSMGTASGFAPPKDAPAGTKFYGYSPDGQRVWKLPDGSMATE